MSEPQLDGGRREGGENETDVSTKSREDSALGVHSSFDEKISHYR